jgi:hypothetical protein
VTNGACLCKEDLFLQVPIFLEATFWWGQETDTLFFKLDKKRGKHLSSLFLFKQIILPLLYESCHYGSK